MNKYFFILGNNKALSVAEILAWLENSEVNFEITKADRDYLVLNIGAELKENLLEELGGTIKFGQILDLIPKANFDSKHIINLLKPADKKYNFGFSVYPKNKKLSFRLRGIGLEIKKEFKQQSISSRLVMSKQENLSSVIVQKNKMLGNAGAEIVFLEDRDKYYIGKTSGVQPFEKLGWRDFGRPQRDDFSGMLPPKLAQIMINLAEIKPGQKVLDPFCGSGTILQELLLRSLNNIYGSDISEKAIEDSKQNIKWLEEKFGIKKNQVKFFTANITELDSVLKEKVDRIITEPFLGPPAREKRNETEIKKILNDLTALYKVTFRVLPKLLKSKSRVVIVFPVLNNYQQDYHLLIDLIVNKDFELKKSLPDELMSIYQLSNRNTLIYQRAGQQVKREILVFDYAK